MPCMQCELYGDLKTVACLLTTFFLPIGTE